MRRKIVERRGVNENIDIRISEFIGKLTNLKGDLKKVNSVVRNELRWLGVESSSPKYGIGTIKAYLTKYKKAVAANLPFDSKYKENIDKLNRKYKGELESIIVNGSTPMTAINAIKQYMAEMSNKTTGLYDDLKRLRVAHKAYYLLHIKPGQNAALKDAKEKAISDNKKERLEISKDAIQEAVKEGLSSKSKYRRLVALALCCGRRPVEIFKTASFDYKNKGECIFSGQAKKKFGKDAKAYVIPIIHVNAKEFIKSFKSYRKMIGDTSNLTNAQINTRLSSDVPKVARGMLRNRDATLYTCRSVYANWIAEQNPDTDRDVLIARILGHDDGDVVTANSYQDVRLVDLPLDEAIKLYESSRQGERERVAAIGREQADSKTYTQTQLKEAERLSKKLEKLQGQAEVEGRAVAGINQWAIEYLQENPDAEFTQTMITKLKGSSRPAIKKWLDLTKDVRI